MRIAVVGGGMAGLFAARALRSRGAEVVLFEAAPKLGGKVGTVRDGGFVAEEGPNAVSGGPIIREAVEREGRTGEIVEAPKGAARWVWLRGKARKAPSPGLLPPWSIARAMLEPVFARRNADDVTLQEFLESHLGRGAGGLAARAMAGGVWAGDPGKLSARAAFAKFVAVADEHRSLILGMMKRRGKGGPTGMWSLRAGLSTIAEAIAPPEGVRLGTPVTALAPSGRAWDVAGAGSFDGVVLSLPAHAAADLLQPFAADLARALGSIDYAPVSVVHLGVRAADFAKPPEGFGMLDGEGSLNVLGTLFPSNLFPGRAPAGHLLLTSMVGGARARGRAALADGALVDLTREDAGRALGLRGTPVWSKVIRHDKAIPQPEVGHLDRVRALRALATRLPPLAFAGAAYDGAAIPDCALSGATAAETLARRIGEGTPAVSASAG